MSDLAVLEKKVNDLSIKLDHKKDDRLDNSLFAPDKAPHYQDLATKLASSELAPKCYRNKPKDLFLAWEFGYQLGMSLAQSMQDIAIINGRPAIYGDALLALVISHPEFVDIKEEPIYKGDELFGYQCTVKRGNRTPTVRKFDLEDAKKAKLLGRPGPWSDYRDRMLQMRARGFACRDAFADSLKGIKSAEEYQGTAIDAEFEEVKPSKAEMIKQDFNADKGATFSEEMDSKEKTVVDKTENEGDTVSANVEESGQKTPDVADQAQEDALITLPQISRINALMKSSKFTKDRKKKAMDYYEVDEVEDMNQSQAEHFIKQLEKA